MQTTNEKVMVMRRMVFLLVLNLFWVTGFSQSAELMRIYTDKDCYLAGEELWIKVSLDDDVLPGNRLSHVAYVEICDTAQVRAQGKIALTQGEGWACIRLPQTMHSGMYQLTAYTRYMRNLKAECFPRKYIAVLNTFGSSEEDNLVVNDSAVFHKSDVIHSAESEWMKGNKNVFGFREKVTLEWSSHLAEARELVLSVVRKDCDVELPELVSASFEPVKDKRWLPECEGHIVKARLEGDVHAEAVLAQLSCVGKEISLFEGKREEKGVYSFYTNGVNNQQDIVLSAVSNEGQAFRMKIETPFVEFLPRQIPDLYCQYEDSALIARSIALQLEQAMPKAVLPKVLEKTIYGQLPDKTYNLDEYVRFNTVKECIVEFVMGVTMDKMNDRMVLKMLLEDGKDYNVVPALVLVDGVAFHDHSEVLAYNAHNIHYIHQYRGNYTLAETVYGGILSLVTHRGTMPDMRIDSDMQMMTYEFPQYHPVFAMPDYGNEKSKASRRPDFRHTMYWEPSATGKTSLEFYTSDLAGKYVATLQGVDANGKKIEVKWEFEVR